MERAIPESGSIGGVPGGSASDLRNDRTRGRCSRRWRASRRPASRCRRRAGLAAGGAGRDHRLFRRSQEVLRLLAEIARAARTTAAEAAPQRRRSRPRPRASRTARARPGCAFCAGTAMRSTMRLTVRRSRFVRVEELVDRGRRRGAGPGSDRAGDRRRGRLACSATRAASRSTRACSCPRCSASERAGRHLCHAMLLPRPEAQALLPQLERDGVVELDGASVAARAARPRS